MKNIYLSRIEKIYNSFNDEEKEMWNYIQLSNLLIRIIKANFLKTHVLRVENYLILKDIMYYSEHRNELLKYREHGVKVPNMKKPNTVWKRYKVGG